MEIDKRNVCDYFQNNFYTILVKIASIKNNSLRYG